MRAAATSIPGGSWSARGIDAPPTNTGTIPHPALQCGPQLQADPIVVCIESFALEPPDGSDPVLADHGDDRVALRERVLKCIREVLADSDRVDVDKHIVDAIVRPKMVGDASGIRRAVVADSSGRFLAQDHGWFKLVSRRHIRPREIGQENRQRAGAARLTQFLKKSWLTRCYHAAHATRSSVRIHRDPSRPGSSLAQTLDKELVASISGPVLDRGIVSELLWDGGTLIIQSAVVQPDGQLTPRYLPRLPRTWNCSASRPHLRPPNATGR